MRKFCRTKLKTLINEDPEVFPVTLFAKNLILKRKRRISQRLLLGDTEAYNPILSCLFICPKCKTREKIGY